MLKPVKRRAPNGRWIRAAVLVATALLFPALWAWQDHDVHQFPVVPLPEKSGPLRKALLLLRESKTEEARAELAEQRKRPNDPDVLYQIARSYLIDFYQLRPSPGSARSRSRSRWKT